MSGGTTLTVEPITPALMRIHETVVQFGGWMNAKQIAVGADVPDRVARRQAAVLARDGIFETSDHFGAPHYRTILAPDEDAEFEIATIQEAKKAYRKDRKSK